MLGFIMAFVTVFGGIGIGAYWAYKNLSISTITDDQVVSPEVDNLTIEDFVADLQAYMSDPNSYTIGELEDKYGIDLSELFGDFAQGLDDDYKNIQLLALFTGDTEALLGSINLSVILGFMPEGMISESAAAELGKHTLLELVKDEDMAHKLTNLLGKTKVGDLLGFVYEDVSGGNINPEYALKEEIKDAIGNEGVAELAAIIGNLEISALIRAFSDSYENDLLDEIMNYDGLGYIGDADIGKLLSEFIPDSVNLPISVETMFGGKTVRDLVSGMLHEYSINFANLLAGMTVADIMGYEVAEDGTVTDSEGEEVRGVLAELADLNVGDLAAALMSMSSEGGVTTEEILDYLLDENGALGGITLGSVMETVMGVQQDEDGNWLDADGEPLEGAMAALSTLFDLNFMEIVGMVRSEDGVTLEKVADLTEGITLGDFINPIVGLKEEDGKIVDADGEEPTGIYAILAGVSEISVPDVINGIEAVIEDQNVVPLIDAIAIDGLGTVEIGSVMGYGKDEDGNWIDADGEEVSPLISAVLDYSLGGLLETFVAIDENGDRVFDLDVVETIDYLLSDISVNSILESLLPDIYEKVSAVATGSIAELLETPIGTVIKAFDPSKKEEIETVIGSILVKDAAETAKNILHEIGVEVKAIDLILDEIGNEDLIGNYYVYDVEGIQKAVIEEIHLDEYLEAVERIIVGLELIEEDSAIVDLIDDLEKYVAPYTIATIKDFDWRNIKIEDLLDTVDVIAAIFVDDISMIDEITEYIANDVFVPGTTIAEHELQPLTVVAIVKHVREIARTVMPEGETTDKVVAALDVAVDL
ncbi:MAG: hypothetical protein J6U35_01735, partial [Clostridia bacterium]|nr:hypothetical protein [Clostridia bacterium]